MVALLARHSPGGIRYSHGGAQGSGANLVVRLGNTQAMAGDKVGTVHGWVMLDKPAGITSRSALTAVRRALGVDKAGHAGTLDPAATGLLPIAVGEATKVIPLLAHCHKVYDFTVVWGVATDTDDAAGEVIATCSLLPSAPAIADCIHQFTGDIMQRPPRYSAVKIAGTRAYARARAGEDFEIQARLAHVYELRLTGERGEHGCSFRVRCGSGTYVRSLARDMASALGTFGHVSRLRRVAIGGYDVGGAQGYLCGEHAAAGYPLAPLVETAATLCGADRLLEVGERFARRIRQGQRVVLPREQLPTSMSEDRREDAPVLLVHCGNRAVALAQLDGLVLRPRRIIWDAAAD